MELVSVESHLIKDASKVAPLWHVAERLPVVPAHSNVVLLLRLVSADSFTLSVGGRNVFLRHLVALGGERPSSLRSEWLGDRELSLRKGVGPSSGGRIRVLTSRDSGEVPELHDERLDLVLLDREDGAGVLLDVRDLLSGACVLVRELRRNLTDACEIVVVLELLIRVSILTLF